MLRTVFFAALSVFLYANTLHAHIAWAELTADSPLVKDWILQDSRTEPVDDAYIKACQERRDTRLKTLKEQFPKIVFTKHFDLGGSHYAYTEAQSDAQAERNFVAGTALCVIELNASGDYEERTLISDPNGLIRDPAVSYDGKQIVFAWKKSDRLDDYHLYEYNVETGDVRQLTFGLGYADYEPCILPDETLFSTQPVACKLSTAGGRKFQTCIVATRTGGFYVGFPTTRYTRISRRFLKTVASFTRVGITMTGVRFSRKGCFK